MKNTRAKKEVFHGHVGTREYRAWQRMKNRCNNPNATQWKWYGGRGIKVCDRWNRSFLDFLSDMGKAPSQKHTIDRVDQNGNYEPKNCRWATMQEQQKHKRPRSDCVWLTWKGKTQTVTEWAKEVGIPRWTLFQRVSAGWDTESILTLRPQPGVSPGGWRQLSPKPSSTRSPKD